MIKKITVLLVSFIALISNISLAQDSAIEQTFHESGKINVVIAVVTVIFIGLLVYLVKLDRKVSRLEKNSEK